MNEQTDTLAAQLERMYRFPVGGDPVILVRLTALEETLVSLDRSQRDREALHQMAINKLEAVDRERMGCLERGIAEREQLHLAAHVREHAMSEKAIDKADASLADWKHSANEFRGQLTDQAATFLRQEVADAAHTAIRQRMDTLVQSTTDRLTDQLAAVDARNTAAATTNTARIAAIEVQFSNLMGRLTILGIMGMLIAGVVGGIVSRLVH